MTHALPNNNDLAMNLERFNAAQASQIEAILDHTSQQMRALTTQERVVYTSLWSLIAHSNVPVPIKGLRLRGVGDTLATVDHLAQQDVLWYDREMQAVLQCSPFSALKTDHQVKTFGWKAAYVCHFIGAPLALLLYGPNTWLDVRSLCPRSGETLAYRVQLDEQHHLRVDAPPEADRWRVWIGDGSLQRPCGQPKIEPRAFATQDDFDTHRQTHPQRAGMIYNFDESILISECLLRIYKQALSD